MKSGEAKTGRCGQNSTAVGMSREGAGDETTPRCSFNSRAVEKRLYFVSGKQGMNVKEWRKEPAKREQCAGHWLGVMCAGCVLATIHCDMRERRMFG